MYVFQQTDYLNLFLRFIAYDLVAQPTTAFVFNKTFRLVLNDMLCIVLIYAIFEERKYMQIAFYVFCFELIVLLPAYLIVKLSLEGTSEISSPLLSQIHRLIVNPMLMLILMTGFYFQRRQASLKDR